MSVPTCRPRCYLSEHNPLFYRGRSPAEESPVATLLQDWAEELSSVACLKTNRQTDSLPGDFELEKQTQQGPCRYCYLGIFGIVTSAKACSALWMSLFCVNMVSPHVCYLSHGLPFLEALLALCGSKPLQFPEHSLIHVHPWLCTCLHTGCLFPAILSLCCSCTSHPAGLLHAERPSLPY